jgi:hypothetical protein
MVSKACYYISEQMELFAMFKHFNIYDIQLLLINNKEN